MIKYAFDISLWVWRMLPPVLRTDTLLAGWYEALLMPLKTFLNVFLAFAQKSRIDAALNSQTGVLEYALNAAFSPTIGGIYIDNVYFNVSIGQQFLYFLPETEVFWKFLSEGGATAGNYASFLSEYFSYGSTFIVYVPLAITLDENALKALINKYLLADKTYTIVYY